MRCKPSHALDLQEIAEPIHQRSEAGALLDIGHAGEGLGGLINTLDREQRARRNLWDRQQKQGGSDRSRRGDDAPE